MTCTAATTPTTISFRSKRSFTVAFLLVATAVLADVIRIGECRSLLEDHRQLQQVPSETDIIDDYQNDGAITGADDDEDAEPETGGGNNSSAPPRILTTGLTVETAEGTTVNLPCKVSEGSLEYVALMWINGTKSIMTDAFPSSTDPRIKPGPTSESSSAGPTDHTLIIEEVTRWDTGLYTCRITSTPPVEITHSLRVTHPARIVSIQSPGVAGPLNTGTKKLVVKQDEPVQLICNVVGYPKPSVQWVRKGKHHQHNNPATSAGQDQNPAPQQPAPVVVSNSNEVRIEAVSAHQHAGYYECIARNSDSESTFSRLEIDLEVEYKPEVTVLRKVVNTGETYVADMWCYVHSHPKSKVTWEKEQISVMGSTSWQPVNVDAKNSRYEIPKKSAAAKSQQRNGGNNSTGSIGQGFGLKVNKVQGPQDFGNYRCKAENKLGTSYSDIILLTGTPAQPRSTYVHVKPSTAPAETKMPELGWTVDSWSPLLEYQLQYKKQQDSEWTDVWPQPPISEKYSSNNGDEFKYTMSYVFGIDGQPTASDFTALSLEPGNTYIAHLRARNFHGWSDWSTDVVFSGGVDNDQGTNEIQQSHDDSTVSKASVGGNTGGASDLRQSCGVVATAFVLAVTLMAANTVR